MEVRASQDWNAFTPISFREPPKSTLVRLSQSAKALSPTLVTPPVSTTFLMSLR